MSFNIAIDGPAGAGKSTIAREVARKLGFVYVDTGAMYRAIGLYFIRQGIGPDDHEKMDRALKDANVTIQYKDGIQQVILNGEAVSDQIRTEAVGAMASAAGAYGPVREKLLDLQRNLARWSDVIMDGRDIGTNILPGAQLKIYLTASTKARALRRYTELIQKGVSCTLEDIEAQITKRDNDYMNRAVAPLRQAEDAVYLDTSDLSIDQVIESIIKLYEDKNV